MIRNARDRLPDGHIFRRALLYGAWSMQLAQEEEEAEQLLKELNDLNETDLSEEGVYIRGTVSRLRGRLALQRGEDELAIRHYTKAAADLSQAVGENYSGVIESRARIKELSQRASVKLDESPR
ncbi:MAG TPA: hypothetical protein VJP45_12635, partial [Candidatus Limnocylindria bacterium]|nr:hypothetical protein [Candidatus Limnocylindria bacterium]